jgi:RNA polymerase sigma factor (sigma-70 family)
VEKRADAELVAQARAGDKAAFDTLFERHQAMAERVAFGMVGNAGTAQELAQEAMLQAYLSLAHLRDGERFPSWLHGIVLNVCRSYLRERKVPWLSWEELTGRPLGKTADVADWGPDPLALAAERERRRQVLETVNTLSPKQRAVTLLFYYDQLSLQEIAARLGISVVAVKGRLHQARKQIRERLLPIYAETLQVMSRERKRRAMVKVSIAGVFEEPAEQERRGWTVILADEAGSRALRIWIGRFEAHGIEAGLTHHSYPRPPTYHFMSSLLEAAGARLEEVRVEALRENTYYAIAKLRAGETVRELDARPSDALALATHTGSPVYVASDLLEMEIPEFVQYGIGAWQSFVDETRRAVRFAWGEAGRLGESRVGTEHLLLGLLEEKESGGVRVLERLGILLERVRSELEARMTHAEGNEGKALHFTPRARRAIDLAWDEAEAMKQDQIGTEHLLLGLIGEGDGLGGRVLIELGADRERARAAVEVKARGE